MASSTPIPLPLALAVLDGSVTLRGSPKRSLPAPAQPLSDKAQQRLIRQAVVQAELEAEEREALKITKEELQILQDSVKSVKAEFTDLDGLSWETPEARQILDQWHAEQAARACARSLSHIGHIPLRRPNLSSTSNAPAPHTLPSLSLSVAMSMPDLTPMPSPVDESCEDTIRPSLCVDSRRSSSSSTIVPDRDDARTPLPSLYASIEGKENDAPAEDIRPGMVKSYSAPHLTSYTDPFAPDQSSHIQPARTTKSLPPSRIPVRSKSLSAKPSPSWRTVDGKPSQRRTSLIIRRTGARAAMSPSLSGNMCPPAKRSFADALSASPRRAHPPLPLRSPARTRFPLVEGSPSKFRIISAPPMKAGPPTFPARNRAASARIASGSALAPAASTSPVHEVPEAGGSPVRRPGGTPVRRMSKRLRTNEEGSDAEDGECEPPSPSPSRTRARSVALGGVPMRRT